MTDPADLKYNIIVNLRKLEARYALSAAESLSNGMQMDAAEDLHHAEAVRIVWGEIDSGKYDTIQMDPWLDGTRAASEYERDAGGVK